MAEQSLNPHRDNNTDILQQNVLDFGSDSDKAFVVGDELITPTARLAGETDNGAAEKRGWLAAITNATQEAQENGSLQNVLNISTEAIRRGVATKDEVNQHLLSMGLDAQRIHALQTGKSGGSNISESQIRAYLKEIELQIPKIKEGLLSQSSFQSFIDEAKKVGVPLEKIRSLLKHAGADIISSSVVKNEAAIELNDQEIQQLSENAHQYAANHGEDSFFGSMPYEPIALKKARNSIPSEVGQRFDAHGIAKGTYREQLQSLINLLHSGPDPNRRFDTAKIRLSDEEESAAAGAIGAFGVYDTGSFIVISKPDQSIEMGNKNSIKAIAVNEHFYDAIPLLQDRFPNIRFIKATDLTRGLTDIVKEEEI